MQHHFEPLTPSLPDDALPRRPIIQIPPLDLPGLPGLLWRLIRSTVLPAVARSLYEPACQLVDLAEEVVRRTGENVFDWLRRELHDLAETVAGEPIEPHQHGG